MKNNFQNWTYPYGIPVNFLQAWNKSEHCYTDEKSKNSAKVAQEHMIGIICNFIAQDYFICYHCYLHWVHFQPDYTQSSSYKLGYRTDSKNIQWIWPGSSKSQFLAWRQNLEEEKFRLFTKKESLVESFLSESSPL